MEEIMTLNNGFAELLRAADAIQHDSKDFVVKANTLKMTDELELMGMKMSSFASSGLCGKMKIPTVYFNRCADANPQLAAQNMNYWLANDSRDLMLRTYKNGIRGCLSASYSIFDAPDILRAMDDALDMSKYKLKGSFISEERLHLRVIEKEMLPIEGEDLFAGFTLDSSDVGRSGLYVRFFIWKQVCTNGLVVPKNSGELFRQKHIGITSEEFGKGLIEGFQSFGDIKTKISDAIIESKDTNVDIDKIIEDVRSRTKLTDDAIDEILMLADTSYDRSRWGIINGITEVAQKYTLERRLQLEQIAGEMLIK